MRLECSGEVAPVTPESETESAAADSKAQRAVKSPPNAPGEGERETELLEAIQQEAEELSAACRASESRRPQPTGGAAGLFPEVSPHDSDCELLDVDPMSIDEYMNRLYARTQRNGSKTREGAAARQAATPTFPVEPARGEEARVSETSPPAEQVVTTPPAPFADAVTEIDEQVVVSRDPAGDARTSANGAGDTREIRNNLREIVIETTRSTLVQHIRRRHQLVLVRKLLVIFMALGLASFLYAAHFINGVPLKHLAWGATAIGLIGLLGMVQLWSRAARQQKRLQGRISYAHRRPNATNGAAGTRTPPIPNRPSKA
jgi:hypothetical protein